jgi:branched-chain amino acid aminotransferase
VIVHLDGQWLAAADASVPISDRGFLFGDGVFETARLHHGAYFRLPDHLDRLRRSAELMRLPVPEAAGLEHVAHELARRNKLVEGTLRITITRGPTSSAHGTLLATLQPLPAAARQHAARGWRVITARTRRPPPAAVPPELKAIGRPYAILARLEAEHAAADDALLLSHDGYVAEGTAWNVFWCAAGRLFTPELRVGILGGITRGVLIEIATGLGLTVTQGAWTPDALEDADEIFASMTSLGVVSFQSLDGRSLPAERPVGERLLRHYWERVAAECAGE